MYAGFCEHQKDQQLYNQDFIEANFQSYGKLGVYTIGEQNIEIQNLIAEKTQRKAELERQIAERTAEKLRAPCSARSRIIAGTGQKQYARRLMHLTILQSK